MRSLEPTEALVRAASLYLPIGVALALVVRRRPDRRRVAGALLATVWNVVMLLAVNLVAVRAGWWTFNADVAVVAGVPADLWLGWALLWGAVPMLAGTGRTIPLAAASVALVAADVVLMPLAEPVVVLGRWWLVGEVVAVVTCLGPGLLLGRWTERDEQLDGRVALQVVGFAGLVFFVLPTLVFTAAPDAAGGWDVLLARPRWHLVLAGVVLAPAGAIAIQAVREFGLHGGTPLPLDPPRSLVTTGPYAYVANPMQAGATVLLAGWGVLLGAPSVVAAAAMGVVFSAGIAAWNEDGELRRRFGDDWLDHRRQVRPWLPRPRPRATGVAVLYVAGTCDPCSQVGRFFVRRRPVGLDIVPAERSAVPLRRITYVRDGRTSSGIAAIGRGLEHLHLGWAVVGWIGRLPGVRPLLQLITDAVGGGPRAVPQCGGVGPRGT